MCWNAAQATTHARVRGAHSGLSAAALQVLREHGPAAAAHWPLAGLPMLVPVPAVPVRGRTPAVGETVILLHLPLPLVGDSIGMWRERQQNDSLADGYRTLQYQTVSKLSIVQSLPSFSSMALPFVVAITRELDGSSATCAAPVHRATATSHWRDCHFADTPSPCLLKHPLQREGGAAE